MAEVRLPAVAGRFYPADAEELRSQLNQLLISDAKLLNAQCKALIVPHAGYIFSGPVAATAYRLLAERADIKRVVLLGPAHYVPLTGLAVPSAASFATPLGSIPLDVEAIEMLLQLPQVVCSDEAHAPEHCLEVQLPFLQMMLGEFKLIPLIVGLSSAQEVADVLARVWGGSETLILISSDLSHYHDYQTAKRIDAVTSEVICRLQPDLNGDQACGCYAVNGLLQIAKDRAMRVELLDLCNSGDTAGDSARVVGYGAYALY